MMGVGFTVYGDVVVSTLSEGRDYTITLEDQNPDPGSPTEPVTLNATVSWTPAPDFDTYQAVQ